MTEEPFRVGPQRTIALNFNFGLDANAIGEDTVLVFDYNGTSGDDFQVFYPEQDPAFIVPQTTNGGRSVGSPEAGLTNQQNWDTYGIAIAGGLTPCLDDTTRPQILGFTCPIGAVVPDPNPDPNPEPDPPTFRGERGSARGAYQTITVNGTTQEIVAPFWTVDTTPRDQFGNVVADAQFQISGSDPFTPEESLSYPLGAKISIRGRLGRGIGAWQRVTFAEGLTEIGSLFWTVDSIARDQLGNEASIRGIVLRGRSLSLWRGLLRSEGFFRFSIRR
jgi:hypothetical protein